MVNPEDIERLIKTMGLPAALIGVVKNELKVNFELGVEYIEKLADRNIINISPEVLNFLDEYNFDLIKGMNDDLANKLRDTLKRGMLDGDNKKETISKIKDIFNVTKERAKTIARTETVRAYSQGQQVAAQNAGIDLVKYWLPVNDNRTSDACRRLGHKYDREHAIGIDKQFRDDGSGWSGISSPQHPNCRCSIIYRPKKAKV